MIITKAAIKTPCGTAFVPLIDAAADVIRTDGSYVFRVWAFDTETRDYVFDTGISDSPRPFGADPCGPVCIFPQPAH